MIPSQSPEAQAEGWLAREVTACDRRKTVIVEGVRPDEPMSPQKARQVATLLQDLMRFCMEEIKARFTTEEEIFLSVNGLPYQRYVMGSSLPYLPVHGKPHSKREIQIGAAEYKKMVDEGNKLFHDPTLGKNGISCDICHPDASNTHPETYRKFQKQMGRVVENWEMINWCLQLTCCSNRLLIDFRVKQSGFSFLNSLFSGEKPLFR